MAMTPEPGGAVGDGLDARFRRLRRKRAASIAAYAMHERHPDAAVLNGRKGGRARAAQFRNRSVMMRWLALRRWHGPYAGPPPLPKILRRAASEES